MLLERLCDLNSPFVLKLGHAQQADAHYGDDDGGDEAKDALPDVLSGTENVLSEAIEGANERSTDGQADEQTETYSKPDLFEQSLVNSRISLRPANALLEESQQDRHDDRALEAFSVIIR